MRLGIDIEQAQLRGVGPGRGITVDPVNRCKPDHVAVVVLDNDDVTRMFENPGLFSRTDMKTFSSRYELQGNDCAMKAACPTSVAAVEQDIGFAAVRGFPQRSDRANFQIAVFGISATLTSFPVYRGPEPGVKGNGGSPVKVSGIRLLRLVGTTVGASTGPM